MSNISYVKIFVSRKCKTIEEALEEAKSIQEKIGCPVGFKFEHRTPYVYTGNNEAQLLRQYARMNATATELLSKMKK